MRQTTKECDEYTEYVRTFVGRMVHEIRIRQLHAAATATPVQIRGYAMTRLSVEILVVPVIPFVHGRGRLVNDRQRLTVVVRSGYKLRTYPLYTCIYVDNDNDKMAHVRYTHMYR